jgi:hypothetical protein
MFTALSGSFCGDQQARRWSPWLQCRNRISSSARNWFHILSCKMSIWHYPLFNRRPYPG